MVLNAITNAVGRVYISYAYVHVSSLKCHHLRKGSFELSLQITFFYLLFGCPSINFGPVSRGQPRAPILITPFYQSLT